MLKHGAWMEELNRDIVLKKTEELVLLLKNSYTYNRYINITEQMKKDKEIIALIQKVKKLQKEIVRLEYFKQDTEIKEKCLRDVLSILNSYPIYKEYTYLVEDLNGIFQGIKMIFESYLNSKIN